MNVVWASDRDWQGSGGAERADRDMVSCRPDDVKLTIVAPGFLVDDQRDEGLSADAVMKCDRVIVSGFVNFPREELALFATRDALVWSHDMRTLGHPLHGLARDLVCLTPLHLLLERAALHQSPSWPGPNIHLCPGWLDTRPWDDDVFDVPAADRGETALWAHRPVWQKNVQGAMAWAEANGIELRVMMARPHRDVIAAMATSRYFVLLSHEVDPGPWSIIEAQLSGCELVVNELVGYFDIDRAELKHILSHQDQVFWSLVKGEAVDG